MLPPIHRLGGPSSRQPCTMNRRIQHYLLVVFCTLCGGDAVRGQIVAVWMAICSSLQNCGRKSSRKHLVKHLVKHLGSRIDVRSWSLHIDPRVTHFILVANPDLLEAVQDRWYAAEEYGSYLSQTCDYILHCFVLWHNVLLLSVEISWWTGDVAYI